MEQKPKIVVEVSIAVWTALREDRGRERLTA
jgi:hypothetical protein